MVLYSGYRYVLIFCSLFLVLGACDYFVPAEQEKPLARVYDKYLYPSDLRSYIAEEFNGDDSIVYANTYIEGWIRKNILLQKAELNLSEEQKDVQEQLDDYRTSLLIHRYKDQLIKEKLDVTITQEEVSQYYDKYKENFHLDEHIVQSLYIKVSKDAPDLNRLFKLYKTSDEEELKELEDYVYHYAVQYDYMREEWIPLAELVEKIPYQSDNPSKLLENRKYLEAQDSLFYYMVHIFDYKLAGEMAPVEFVKDDITDILLNKKRIQYFHNMEKEMYNQARVNNHFEIFK